MSVDIATLQIRIDSSETQNATRNLDQMNNAGGRAETVTSSLADAARKLQGALAVLGIVKIVSEIIKMSDAYDQMTARLKIATNSTSQFLTVQKELIGLSERQRVSLESTTDLYAKASAATADMGASQKDILKFTEGVSAALMINGSSAESAAGALNQLGQALGGAKIQAEEYNSILDGARPLLQAVANNIGATGGSVAMLTSLVRAGKVDSAEFFAAAVKGADELIASGKEIPITFSQAIGIAKDRLMVFVGGMNESTGVVTAMSQSVVFASNAIVFMAKNLDAVVSIVGTLIAARVISWTFDFATGLYATAAASRAAAAASIVAAQADVAATAAARTLALARVAELEATVAATAGGSALIIATTSLAGAQARAVIAEEAHIATLLALTAAQRAASVAAGVLTGAMTLLGGPIGLIITALGIGATAWYLWGKSSTDAQDAASGGMEQSTSEILANIEKQNVKLRERIALAKAGQTELAKTESPAAQEAAKTLSKLNDLRSRAATLTGVEQITVVELTAKYEQLTGAMKGNLGLKNELERLNTKKTTADWMVEYATKAEKLAAKLAEVGKSYKDGAIPPELKKRIEDSFAAQDSGAKKSAESLKESTKSAQDFIDAMQIEASEIGKSEDQVKMMAAARAAAKAPTAALRLEIMSEALALSIAKTAWEEKLEAEKKAADLQKNYDDTADGVWEQVRAIEAEIQAYGKLASEVTGLGIAKVTAALQAPELTDAETAALERKLAALQRLQTLQGIKQGLDTSSSVAMAKELLDILTAVDAATKSAADGMAASFGKVGSAIGGLTTALSGYAVQQQAIAAQLAADKADPKNATKIADLEIAAAHKSAQVKIKSYGDMAAAGKGFFKENTAGYRAMEGAEKAFRAVEMAMAIESMVKKLFTVTAVTTATVGGEAAKAAAVQAGVATQLAADTVKGTSAAAVAVATQAAGDPYTAWVRMAAMVAAMAALGFAVAGGGGSDSTAKDRQALTGTGTVLGDSSAKSESIAHSLAIMEKNSGLGLAHSSSMVVSLKQIVSGIGGLGSLLVRNSGLTGDVNVAQSSGGLGGLAVSTSKLFGGLGPMGDIMGKVAGTLVNSIFGGKISVLDTGLTVGRASLGNAIADGVTASQYVDTKKSGGWFSSDKYRTGLTGLGEEANDQFTKILLGLRTTIVGAADMLGMGGAEFTNQLNAFVVDLGKISLKDLKGDELQAALETAFSKLGDDMAKFGVAGLEKYRAVGEGYLETLARVANDQMQVNDVLAVLGKSFNVTGLGAIQLSQDMITAAGGLETLTSGTSFFVQNFLSEAERMAPITKSVNEAMGKLGLAGVTTIDGFKAAVLSAADGAVVGKTGAAELYAALLGLAEPFKASADYAAELAAATGQYAAAAKTASEIASERKDLQSQLDQLTLTTLQLRAKERETIDASNRALFDQVTARQDLATAYETESSAITSTIEKLTTFATSIKTFRDGLVVGSLSTLSASEKTAEAQRQYSTMLAAARTGDAAAQAGLAGAATAYLTASQASAGTAGTYARDYARVQADMAIMAANVGSQLTAAQSQQIALDKQVAGLITLNDSVKAGAATVAQAIASLGVKQIAGSHAGGLTSVPYDGYTAELHAGERVLNAYEARNYSGQSSGSNEAMLAEMRALREEVKGLRAEKRLNRIEEKAENIAIAQNTGTVARVIKRFDDNGMLVYATTPIPTKEVAAA